jgi:hypothetical protein
VVDHLIAQSSPTLAQNSDASLTLGPSTPLLAALIPSMRCLCLVSCSLAWPLRSFSSTLASLSDSSSAQPRGSVDEEDVMIMN